MDEDISVVLQQLDFFSYLDHNAILNFNVSSKLCYNTTLPHILSHTTLYTPISCEEDPFPSFLGVFQHKIKKLFWCFTAKGILEIGLFPYFPNLMNITHLTLAGYFNTEVTYKSLPPSLTHLTFGHRFDQNVDNLPSNIICLHFGDAFNHTVDHLPQKLKHLMFFHKKDPQHRGKFKQPIDHLPPSLRTLHLNSEFSGSTDNLPSSLTELYILYPNNLDLLPDSLIKLTFMSSSISLSHLPISLKYLKISEFNKFNAPLTILPPKLKHMILSDSLYHNIDSLPSTITHIEFGDNFCKPVDNLPPFLTHLKFGQKFNIEANNLPPTLKFLSFGFYFDQPVNKLPSSLKLLHFGFYFNQPIDKLPCGLATLHIESRDFQSYLDCLPPFLIDFHFEFYIFSELRRFRFAEILKKGISFPNSLKKLYIQTGFSVIGPTLDDLILIQHMLDNLPSSMTHLTINENPMHHLDHLPPNLTHLNVYHCKQITSFDFLPETLINLHLSDNACLPVDYLPISLTHFQLDQDVSLDYLPGNLTHLKLHAGYNKNLDHLPSSLTHLTIDSKFAQSIDNLPVSLIYLEFKGWRSFNNPVDHLPKSLKTLLLNGYRSSIDYLPEGLKYLQLTSKKQDISHLPLLLTNLQIDV